MRWKSRFHSIPRGTHLFHPSYSEVGKEVSEFYVETQSARSFSRDPNTRAGETYGYPRPYL